MKPIDLRSGATLRDLLQLAAESNLILKTGDGKEFLLAEIDDLEREIALVRQQPELHGVLGAASKPARTYSLDEAR